MRDCWGCYLRLLFCIRIQDDLSIMIEGELDVCPEWSERLSFCLQEPMEDTIFKPVQFVFQVSQAGQFGSQESARLGMAAPIHTHCCHLRVLMPHACNLTARDSLHCLNFQCFRFVCTVLTVMPNPGSWRMQDKIGLSLDDIHIQGNVPQCTLFCFVVAFLGIFVMGIDCIWLIAQHPRYYYYIE